MMVFAQAPVFVLAKMRPLSELGVFSQASGLSRIPLTLFNTAIMRLMLPAFSQVKNDAVRLRVVVAGAMTVVTALGIPLAVFLAIFARPLLGIAYGAQYEGGAAVLALAGVCAVLASLNACASNVFFVKAEPGAYRKYTVIRVAALLAAVVPAISQFGIAGVPAATLAALVAVFPFQMSGAKRLAGVGNAEALKGATYGLAAGGVTAVLSLVVKGFAGGNAWVEVIAGAVVAVAAAGGAGLMTVPLLARGVRAREAAAGPDATEEAK
jgi:O-antigen/teichoic acid export membrane protein